MIPAAVTQGGQIVLQDTAARSADDVSDE